MKTLILTIAILIISNVNVFSQKSFEQSMNENLEILRNDSTGENTLKVMETFTKISKKNKKRFEPLYFSAYSNILISFNKKDNPEKEKILATALKQIEKAMKLEKENSELHTLKAFYYQAMITVNPRERGPVFSQKAEAELKKAEELNKNNPRVFFLRGMNIYHTPVQYGGGKENAKPLFEKADQLFKNNTDLLLPQWGKKTNSKMLKTC